MESIHRSFSIPVKAKQILVWILGQWQHVSVLRSLPLTWHKLDIAMYCICDVRASLPGPDRPGPELTTWHQPPVYAVQCIYCGLTTSVLWPMPASIHYWFLFVEECTTCSHLVQEHGLGCLSSAQLLVSAKNPHGLTTGFLLVTQEIACGMLSLLHEHWKVYGMCVCVGGGHYVYECKQLFVSFIDIQCLMNWGIFQGSADG